MDGDDAFKRVIEQVMPLIRDHLREDALNAGHDIHARIERFVTHEQYQRAWQDVVGALNQLCADARLTEYVLTQVLAAHRPPGH